LTSGGFRIVSDTLVIGGGLAPSFAFITSSYQEYNAVCSLSSAPL